MQTMKRKLVFVSIAFTVMAMLLSLCRCTRRRQALFPKISSYRLAKTEIDNGNYALALELIDQYFRDIFEQEYLGSYGVLVTHALPIWMQLNGTYPPSRERMESLVEKLAGHLRTGEVAEVVLDPKYLEQMNPQGDPQVRRELVLAAVADYCFMFQGALGQQQQVLELFEQLMAKEPSVAKRVWPSVRDFVFKARRYDIAVQYVPNWKENCYYLLKKVDKDIQEDPIDRRVYLRTPKYYTGLRTRQLTQFLDLGLYLGQTEEVCEVVSAILERGDFEERSFAKYLSIENTPAQDKIPGEPEESHESAL